MSEFSDMTHNLPQDFTEPCNNDVPAAYCDAPFDANQSLEERLQEMHSGCTFSDGSDEQLTSGYPEIDPFELAEDLGSVSEGIRGARDGASETEELNTALNHQDSGNNCDLPDDIGVDFNET